VTVIRARDVIRLHMGHFIAPEHLPLGGAAIVVSAFLVRHATGPILIDTGLGEGWPQVDAMYRPVRSDFDGLLRGAGTSVADIRAVANCHLHFDHSGNNFRFARVPIFAQKVEHAAATGPNYTMPEKVVDFSGARFELLEGEAEIVPGVRIVPTPGHVAGHQSFVIDTKDGRIVIAGQAFQDAAEYGRALYAWRLDREGQPHPEYAPWVARLQELDPWRVTFAHDLAVWERGT
jgi:glyoxylase-like metal-dependent hydrolase (beta-lactamase superfamily II)